MLTADALERYERFIDMNTGDGLQFTSRILLHEVRTLQQQNAQLIEVLESIATADTSMFYSPNDILVTDIINRARQAVKGNNT